MRAVLDVGSILAGKLRIERILGQGGMGIVAEATHLQLDQRVAVKVMRDQIAGDPATVQRFIREARAAAKLKSDNVCRVSDVGVLPSGAPYIVMELLDGTDLARLVAKSPLPIATAVDYVLQACIAIAEAHVHGIVHRDLKPANLFVTKQLGGAPLVKVLDFGIAKAPSKAEPSLTQTESVMGSPGYMSPEQLRSSRDVDARTDIWAIGVILYQLVSARLPFPAVSVTELAVKVAMDPPDPLTGIDTTFAAVVMRCLEKPPEQRYSDVPALAAALAPFGSDSARRSLAIIEQLRPDAAPTIHSGQHKVVDASMATAPTLGPAPVTTLQGATGHVVSTPTPARPVSKAVLWAAAGIVVVGGVTGAVIATRDGGETKSPAASQKPSLAQLNTSFDIAVERGRCREATRLDQQIRDSGGSGDTQVRLNKCLLKQADAFNSLKNPASVRTILTMAQELMDDGEMSGARDLADVLLRDDDHNDAARALGLQAACKEGRADIATDYAKRLARGGARDAAVTYCKGFGIDVGKVEVTTAPPPSADDDWKHDAGMAMMNGDFEVARDLALAALAKDPGDLHAAYIATGAYCSMGDAANARKWGAKLDQKRHADAQRFACDREHIELPPPAKPAKAAE